ncbi:MAG: type IV toxin-antitoxin system AbiEi family antitoxin domain-containing protein [Solirubrobacterales bacterium]
MRPKVDNADGRIARIAGRQHGIVAVTQLSQAGIDSSGVARRVRAGRLHRLFRGVYSVGNPRPNQQGWWMAAVRACGEGAALSHTSAAALWGLLKPRGGPIHVTSPSLNGRARRSGIVLHRSASLAAPSPPQVTSRQGIPVTTPQRTIDDLRGLVAPHEERRAIRQAQLAGYRLDAATGRRTRRTRSDLELAFLRLWARNGIPDPEVNVKVGSWTVDFLWRAHRVAVETDFYDYHRGSVAFEDDHRRDLELRRAGFRVCRYTDKQLDDSPGIVLADLREALGIEPGQ